MDKELIEILIELAEIVCVLSDDPNYSFGWKADEIVSKLKALQESLIESESKD